MSKTLVMLLVVVETLYHLCPQAKVLSGRFVEDHDAVVDFAAVKRNYSTIWPPDPKRPRFNDRKACSSITTEEECDRRNPRCWWHPFEQQCHTSYIHDSMAELRTCWIDFDADGKRRKPWRKTLSEGSVEVYRNSLVTGGVQALFWAKQVFFSGGRPSGWLREWARVRGITKRHRVFYDVRTLVAALEAAGEINQVNLVVLVCIEILVRRLPSLVEAHSKGTENPDWTLAASPTSASDAGDVVPTNLRSSAMRETKERMDIENFRARSLASSSRGYTDPLAVDHTGEATRGGSAPYHSPAPSDRSRGRGSRSRGAKTGGGGR
jgi:hypothetical protein